MTTDSIRTSVAMTATSAQPLVPADWAAGEEAFLSSASLADEARRTIDMPNSANPANWSKYLAYLDGLTLHGTPVVDSSKIEISRNDVFELAARARRSGSALDVHTLFWNVMAWGTVGDMRNASGISKFVAASAVRFTEILQKASEASFGGNPRDAYLAFVNDGKVSRLGSAFFSKFLYFSGDRQAYSRRCFIYDDRVRTALNIVRGDEGKLTSKSYFEYSDVVHRWAREATSRSGEVVTADEIEFRLYLLGKYAGSHRHWLRTELAMHRQREATIDFDAVLLRIKGN